MKNTSVSRILITFIAVAIFAGCTKKPTFTMPSVVIEKPISTSASSSSEDTKSSVPASVSSSSRPISALIDVPFSPQAPSANWDALHEEACEEMSLIMTHHYLTHTSLSAKDAEEELQKLIAWEQKNNFKEDVNVTELGSIAEQYFGHRARVLEGVTADDIRSEVAAGHPVIIPAAGRMLHNPYFSGAGPEYHMLVITGYADNGFITNDPGTKQGLKYWYTENVMMNAIHDWTGTKENIISGPKKVLVIE